MQGHLSPAALICDAAIAPRRLPCPSDVLYLPLEDFQRPQSTTSCLPQTMLYVRWSHAP